MFDWQFARKQISENLSSLLVKETVTPSHRAGDCRSLIVVKLASSTISFYTNSYLI